MTGEVVTETRKGDDGGGEEHGRVYWFMHHIAAGFGSVARRHWIVASVVLLTLLAALFISRAWLQPYLLYVRIRLALVVLVAVSIGIAWIVSRRRLLWGKMAIYAVGAGWVLFLVSDYGEVMHRYIALYLRYRTLPIVELDELPITGNERIFPLNAIYSLAHEEIKSHEAHARPTFVRVGNEYRWTMAVEPAYPFERLFGAVRHLFNVTATGAYPNFKKRVEVSFQVSNNLLLGSKTPIATIKRFGLDQYVNYEPADIVAITDDKGDWVQVVSLIRWRGFFFPQPEFGGVRVIPQERGSLAGSFVRMFLGAPGYWVRPQDIPKHPFLMGQDILAFAVSRYIAESFRFQAGPFGPLPGIHKDDIRIPDLPQDLNEQPFTAYFIMRGEEQGMLYHYFGLEPFDPTKQALPLSLFIPADGRHKVFVYRHQERGKPLMGVSAVGSKIRGQKKEYRWEKNPPAENRPFIRHIAGETRFFWLTTIVTYKEEGNKTFIADAIPELVITDAFYKEPVWVDASRPDTWERTLEEKLAQAWTSK